VKGEKTWYKVYRGNLSEVTVIRETIKCVVLKGKSESSMQKDSIVKGSRMIITNNKGFALQQCLHYMEKNYKDAFDLFMHWQKRMKQFKIENGLIPAEKVPAK